MKNAQPIGPLTSIAHASPEFPGRSAESHTAPRGPETKGASGDFTPLNSAGNRRAPSPFRANGDTTVARTAFATAEGWAA